MSRVYISIWLVDSRHGGIGMPPPFLDTDATFIAPKLLLTYLSFWTISQIFLPDQQVALHTWRPSLSLSLFNSTPSISTNTT